MLRFWTAVPEAPIYENRNPFPTKHEVRFAKQRFASAPTANACGFEKRNHSQLGIAIAATSYARHYL